MHTSERKLGFPEVRDFATLFTLVSKDDKGDRWDGIDYDFRTGKKRKAHVMIGPYCQVSGKGGYRSLHVKPCAEVLAYIKQNVLFCGPRDRVTFKIVIRDSGEALVCAENSLILGGTWLALIDPATIPESEEG